MTPCQQPVPSGTDAVSPRSFLAAAAALETIDGAPHAARNGLAGSSDADVGPEQALASLLPLRQVREQLAGWETGLIETARKAGASWADLAHPLGVASRQAAERRYLRGRDHRRTTRPGHPRTPRRPAHHRLLGPPQRRRRAPPRPGEPTRSRSGHTQRRRPAGQAVRLILASPLARRTGRRREPRPPQCGTGLQRRAAHTAAAIGADTHICCGEHWPVVIPGGTSSGDPGREMGPAAGAGGERPGVSGGQDARGGTCEGRGDSKRCLPYPHHHLEVGCRQRQIHWLP
ncbi:hypothetical protein SAMN05444921_13183 [Streptomyces wuyuanensis]|uniref:Uncharacterized protein n=1 Tax=Streptomyces wuyuanensis TaxID=1196353 RepID=A0A1H0CZW6_9ACTN|nr:hypothetical protein SAMN05444921_13183 [Streptomyces wuyuanensis]